MKTKKYSSKFIGFQALVLIVLLFTVNSCNKGNSIPETTTNEDYTESAESPNEVGSSVDETYNVDDPPRVGTENPNTDNVDSPIEQNPEKTGTSSSKNDRDSPKDGAGNSATTNFLPADDYKVILATDEKIYKNESCELKIWIGPEKVEVSFSNGMITDQTSIPATIGQYAKITPYAPDFEVSPPEMNCVKIDPSGSEVRFKLTPKTSGKLKVSANIELFDNADCKGPAVPKTAKTLSVTVTTNKTFVLLDALQQMGAVIWDKFLSFWGLLITLLFATLLFVIRRLIKTKTGYDDKTGG